MIWRQRRSSVWSATAPIREELFGVERLELHAESLAAAQPVTSEPPSVASLRGRLGDNERVLLAAYRATAREVESGRPVVPAAEWLLDNYHLVDAQVREIRNDLSPGYYRQLPKLADGPFAGYPRILGVAWAYVAHTDSHFDAEMLRRFIVAYQRVQPLTIGELWAVAITLRIVLVENLRRLADQITAGHQSRLEADLLANHLLAVGEARTALAADIASRSSAPLSQVFAAQLVKRLRDQDPRAMPALGWLEERLVAQGASIDSVVDNVQQRLGASNVSVRNVITSMRLISDIDWTRLFESMSLVDFRLRARSSFGAMDLPTRNLYRNAIEQLARGSVSTELQITERALEAASLAAAIPANGPSPATEPGHYLIGEGRRTFERALDFRPPMRLRLSRVGIRMGIGGYIGANVVLTVTLTALAMQTLPDTGLSAWGLALVGLAGMLPASEVASALVNRGVAALLGPTRLPGMELVGGIPVSMRTLVAVPTLLSSESELLEQVERLEVHYLSGVSGEVTFALLSDGIDADHEVRAEDAPLLTLATRAIRTLNERHGPGPAGERFLFLHRRRQFNPSENKWMGWERKRGKLHELNRLLRGMPDTSFVATDGVTPHVPGGVRFVITLDADTRLQREVAHQLVGKMAHPLNRPRFDPGGRRVVGGHAILQPRVTPSLPLGREGSLYQRVFSGPGGTDPYAVAVSDVYQDLFGEGSYIGKGIYDVDAFETSLSGRIADNTMLSHDLFEGVFARAGLVSDIEVVEEFPSRYDVVAKRLHRWTRGDWQLLRIMTRRGPARSIPALGRFKMLDNLRRSLLAPATMLGLCLSWLLPLPAAITASLLLISTIAVPAFLPILFSMVPRRLDIRLLTHFAKLGADLQLAGSRVLLSLAFLADQAWRAGDAVLRTLVRLFITRRHLLEWTTAARSSASPRLDIAGFYRQMSGGTSLALVAAVGIVYAAPSSWPVMLPIALLWLCAPALAQWASRAPAASQRLLVTEADAHDLRLIARRTWRYFETFVTAAENHLPPDNFQERPRPVIAHRTSPTNIGLYLLATAAARDFGWAGTLRTIERLEATFGTLIMLPRSHGHFMNWYGTLDLAVLPPAYVSSVDSGNLAGHLIALANACEEWRRDPVLPDPLQGIADALALLRQQMALLPSGIQPGRALAAILDEMDIRLSPTESFDQLAPILERLVDKAAQVCADFTQDTGDVTADIRYWIAAIGTAVAEHGRDRASLADSRQQTMDRLTALASQSRTMALEMDFGALFDSQRELLSIGYTAADNCLDPGCYDLLASEARLASLIAIAKGDLPSRHWFRLGRLATPAGNGSALISWSGSMFEYLMPSLVLRAPSGSMLEQTCRLVVARQQSYGRSLGIPWGISESAYNARDIEFTYQYSNFGVPGLGLKRGLSEDAVVAPYATGLATMVDPMGANRNFVRLARMGALGRHGFYEALDFTPSRLQQGEDVAIVRNFMAHHQGMTIVAIANALHDGRMRSRFHREPMIMASELLLQERTPRDVIVARPRAEEVGVSAHQVRNDIATSRRLVPSRTGAPVTHLLSNGDYAIMLTATGGGYSRWRDIAVTRWREDATRDDWGAFLFVRDVQSAETWSATARPLPADSSEREVVFGEDHAEFTLRHAGLSIALDVIVSSEHNGEVRRLSVTNNGWRTREVELTSYAELVLTTPAADNAHPAFAKMFVQTEYLQESGALVATRRTRSSGEPQVWAGHFAVVEGNASAEAQYETAREHFFGHGRTIQSAVALSGGQALSGTVGTVLDPIFSLRQRLRIGPGEVARVAFWTVVANSRSELLDLIDTHHDRSAFDRARTLAWTQAQVQLRHLDVGTDEAAEFQQLAAPLLYADSRFRASSETIRRGAGPQSGLWQHSISGDLPIVLLKIDDMEDIDQVRQLLRAHQYWRMKRLGADLVIINERASSYVQDLQVAIEATVRIHASPVIPGADPALGSVYVLRADLMSMESRSLLQSVARVVLSARHGPIGDHLARLRRSPEPANAEGNVRRTLTPNTSRNPRARPALEFFNGFGGFDNDGKEYVTILAPGKVTPAPWINVIANEGFGFQVSAEGSGYTWAANSRENQITQWSNDAVTDPPGDAIYIRDTTTGDLWTPTAQPIRNDGIYVARHGFGYSRFEHEAHGIESEVLHFVPQGDPVRISRMRLTNLSGTSRRLSVTAYTEWVLGTARGTSAPFITTEIDTLTGAMLATNPWNGAFASRVAFADLCGKQTAWTADRTEFLGRYRGPDSPRSLVEGLALSGSTGSGLDPCAALQTQVVLGVGETVEIVAILGQGASLEQARNLIIRYRAADLDQILKSVTDLWRSLLGTVQVSTPDRAMDILLNGWLLYQTIACRIWARSAFYQASGAYGFRDQLQDGMALSLALPTATRAHILRSAGRQFVEGDVQHWWLPQSGKGIRTRISDDHLWLAYATAGYVETSGDAAILDERVAYLDGMQLGPAEHEYFFEPMVAEEATSLFEHCARGIDHALSRIGDLGLPLIGTGDWNDGMNRVGQSGLGQSVWVAWLLLRTVDLFAPLAQRRDPARAQRWREQASAVRRSVEQTAWDGAWYRRATFDDGSWLGSIDSIECRIDSIAQSWAVLSGAADPQRAAIAMASMEHHLIHPQDGLALLFTPPFDVTSHDPGYIKGYPPGLRENGGQYSHAAMWAILAFVKLGAREKAHGLFALLNPINHARKAADAQRYRVEPYVVAADVYAVAPHVGRGGWTWYTGSAGWMYRAGTEGILGLRRRGNLLIVDPCIPASWPGFKATINLDGATSTIEVRAIGADEGSERHSQLDGVRIPGETDPVGVPIDGRNHHLLMFV